MKKVYVVRKYVLAENVADALRKEKKNKVDDVFLDTKSTDIYLDSLMKPKELQPVGFNQDKKK